MPKTPTFWLEGCSRHCPQEQHHWLRESCPDHRGWCHYVGVPLGHILLAHSSSSLPCMQCGPPMGGETYFGSATLQPWVEAVQTAFSGKPAPRPFCCCKRTSTVTSSANKLQQCAYHLVSAQSLPAVCWTGFFRASSTGKCQCPGATAAQTGPRQRGTFCPGARQGRWR